MIIPKKQHFVPQHLLKRFTDERDRLFFFERRAVPRIVRHATPKELFSAKHLYSQQNLDGSRDAEVEQFFALLESDADIVIEKIVDNARTDRNVLLSPEDRSIADKYFHYQWRRVPSAIKSTSGLIDGQAALDYSLKKQIIRRGALSSEHVKFFENAGNRTRILRNAQIKSLKLPAPQVLEALSRKPFVVARPDKWQKKSFIITSSPILRTSNSSATDLRDPSVELWLPIASDVMVGYAGTDHIDRPMTLPDNLVRHINLNLARRSDLMAGRSEKLIISMMRAC